MSNHVPIVATMKVIMIDILKRKTVKMLQIDLVRTNNEYRKKIQQITSERIKYNEAVECIAG